MCEVLNIKLDELERRIEDLAEVNPMLGNRGCRLGITIPYLYKMKLEAIFLAIDEVNSDINLEIIIPFINDINELLFIKSNLINRYLDKNSSNHQIKLKIGIMIELPRAAFIADELGKEVDYFSFGTNDLTQTSFGISRDDIASFLPSYFNHNIYNTNPFASIDVKCVGKLIRYAIEGGKKVNSSLTFGICGEHASDPKSIEFFHTIGVNYISCSPYNIPIARIAAAQAKIKFSQ